MNRLLTLRLVNHSVLSSKRKLSTFAFSNKSRLEGSIHWIWERGLSILSLGSIGSAFMLPGEPLVDLGLGTIIPLHCHVGFMAIITDYLPHHKYPFINRISTTSIWAGTLLSIYGLYLFNTKDIGISSTIRDLWSASQTPLTWKGGIRDYFYDNTDQTDD